MSGKPANTAEWQPVQHYVPFSYRLTDHWAQQARARRLGLTPEAIAIDQLERRFRVFGYESADQLTARRNGQLETVAVWNSDGFWSEQFDWWDL